MNVTFIDLILMGATIAGMGYYYENPTQMTIGINIACYSIGAMVVSLFLERK